jgi:hypothetical protein
MMKLTLDATLMVLHIAHAVGYTGLLQKFVIRYEDSKTGIRNGIISPTS